MYQFIVFMFHFPAIVYQFNVFVFLEAQLLQISLVTL